MAGEKQNFFEVIVALSLTGMSIFVSSTANQIASYQNELIKGENQPIFIFNTTYFHKSIYDDSDYGEGMDIYNAGKPAYKFKSEAYVFFDISLYSANHTKMDLLIPVLLYYVDGTVVNAPVGLLQSYSCPIELTNGTHYTYTCNSNVFNKMSDDFFHSGNQNISRLIDLKKYIHITYNDIYNENHDEI